MASFGLFIHDFLKCAGSHQLLACLLNLFLECTLTLARMHVLIKQLLCHSFCLFQFDLFKECQCLVFALVLTFLENVLNLVQVLGLLEDRGVVVDLVAQPWTGNGVSRKC
jgi:hypothetical protein